jgi:hypothetical protein
MVYALFVMLEVDNLGEEIGETVKGNLKRRSLWLGLVAFGVSNRSRGSGTLLFCIAPINRRPPI